MIVITPKESLTRETVTAFLQDNTANTLETIFHLLETGDDWETYLDHRSTDRNFTDGMNDFINTIGLPMFSAMLGREVTIEKITVKNTMDMLQHIYVRDPAPEFNEHITALQKYSDHNVINENAKLPILAYMSSVIGSCMLGKIALGATTVNKNMPIHLDTSPLLHDLSNPPKKPGFFTKLFSSKESYEAKMATYNSRLEEYNRCKNENEVLSAVNERNAVVSNLLVKAVSKHDENGARVPKEKLTSADIEERFKKLTPVVREIETENHMEMGNN